MFYKNIPGTTVSWFLDVIEAKPGSLHSPIYVSIKKDGEEKQIFLDSLAYLVDLLVREFEPEKGLNFIGVPPLTINRATKTIADYFNLGEDFSSDLEYDYYRVLKEEGLPGPSESGVITGSEIKELYERSQLLKRKLYASDITTDDDIQDAIEHLKRDDENAQED